MNTMNAHPPTWHCIVRATNSRTGTCGQGGSNERPAHCGQPLPAPLPEPREFLQGQSWANVHPSKKCFVSLKSTCLEALNLLEETDTSWQYVCQNRAHSIQLLA